MSNKPLDIMKIIIGANLRHQFTCKNCKANLEAYGRAESKEEWSCDKCNVPGATIAILAEAVE